MDIKWEAPPATALFVGTGRQRGRYAELAAALRGRPGDWAKLPDYDNSGRTEKGANATAQNIRRGKVKGFEVKDKEGRFETAIAGTDIWVRFVAAEGEPDGEEDEEDGESDAEVQAHVERSKLTKKVRAWAKAEGMTVPAHGRLPDKVWEAWGRVHFEDGRPKPRAVQ